MPYDYSRQVLIVNHRCHFLTGLILVNVGHFYSGTTIFSSSQNLIELLDLLIYSCSALRFFLFFYVSYVSEECC